jgi:tRNA threonylcarbamoyladenosine biosynthesis protein TsaE
MVEVESSSPEETERVAASVAAGLSPGDVVTVAGELGAGKTTFVRGACRALGVSVAVTSPTYAIGHLYEGSVPVAHLDLFRFDGLEEPDWADLEPYFDGTVAFIEWPEAGEGVLPAETIAVRLQATEATHRMISLHGVGKSLQIG